ncbi:MAG: NfeD family protein [Alphaproteobacteria bacterium]
MINEFINNYNPHSWIILGLLLIVIETFIVPGIGFLFAGLAAFTTGALINFGILENQLYTQIACFLTSSVIYGLILWVPLKKFSKSSPNVIKNIIGDKAIIYDESISSGKTGKVKWSGTIFQARLLDGDQIRYKDTEVEIVKIEGNILIIK